MERVGRNDKTIHGVEYRAMSYLLRRITEADYEFVYQVKKEAYQKYVEMYFGEWDEEQQREFFRSFIETYRSGARIITLDGDDIGFFNGDPTENGYEIGNICIIPEYRNCGFGTAVLEDIIAKYADREITLRYFKANPVCELYERLGFRIIGETTVHYLMKRDSSEQH